MDHSTKYRDRIQREERTAEAAVSLASGSEQPEQKKTPSKSGKEPYKAFNACHAGECDLHVQPNDASCLQGAAPVALPYGTRKYIITDPYNFVISMHFSHEIEYVRLHGEDMKELYDKLRRREVDYIMQFDPLKHEKPEAGQPIVLGIEIELRKRPDKKNASGETASRVNGNEGATTH